MNTSGGYWRPPQAPILQGGLQQAGVGFHSVLGGIAQAGYHRAHNDLKNRSRKTLRGWNL
jgi:hypothetical protein